MVTVEVRHGNVEKALQIFSRKVGKIGIMRELHERSYFIKPSMKRHIQKRSPKKH